jgi:hypothetical protein
LIVICLNFSSDTDPALNLGKAVDQKMSVDDKEGTENAPGKSDEHDRDVHPSADYGQAVSEALTHVAHLKWPGGGIGPGDFAALSQTDERLKAEVTIGFSEGLNERL